MENWPSEERLRRKNEASASLAANSNVTATNERGDSTVSRHVVNYAYTSRDYPDPSKSLCRTQESEAIVLTSLIPMDSWPAAERARRAADADDG